jgi:heme-degrading monooxygenase HmoA
MRVSPCGEWRNRESLRSRVRHEHPEQPMILELADIRIHAGRQAAFDEAIRRGLDTVISRARGFRGYKVNKGIESPERYLLMIFWETLENHTVDFRGSAAFAEWRAIVGPFFAQPPQVEHFTLLAKSGDA